MATSDPLDWAQLESDTCKPTFGFGLQNGPIIVWLKEPWDAK
jgi:hypothetical protein